MRMKQIQINGEMMDVSVDVNTIEQLVNELELKSPVIIVEHNQVVLKKAEHSETKVYEGDQIEFVQFVGGG